MGTVDLKDTNYSVKIYKNDTFFKNFFVMVNFLNLLYYSTDLYYLENLQSSQNHFQLFLDCKVRQFPYTWMIFL